MSAEVASSPPTRIGCVLPPSAPVCRRTALAAWLLFSSSIPAMRGTNRALRARSRIFCAAGRNDGSREVNYRMSLSRPNRISVALCTYNGERFLPQQLAGIQQQTRLPDELVVCDDRSTDRTLAMLGEFAAAVSFPVEIISNTETLGSTKNFEQAIRLCGGDLIALSDQDDLWYPNRLERSEQEFMAHPQAGLVFSDADVIDDQNRPLGETLWQQLGFVGKRKHELLTRQF